MPKKILLIEYEPRYLDRIRGFLEGKGYDLTIARDGDEGLDACRKSRPDLVLVSSVLPKLRTPDVIKGIHDMGSPPPIILMMSGYRGKNREADAHRVGARSILDKPFTEEAFQRELRSVLQGDGPPVPAGRGGPLLSSEDIFSDVLSGIEDEQTTPTPTPAPAVPKPVTGVDKRLHDTLSGLLTPSRKEPAPAVEPRTLKLDTSPSRPAPRVDADMDRILSQTLAELKAGKGTDKAEKTPVPRPAAKEFAELERGIQERAARSGPIQIREATPPSATPPSITPRSVTPPSRPSAPPPPVQAPATPPPISAPPRSAQSLGAGSTFGRYQLLEKIAAGGMAEVFKARMRGEEGFEKIVAIKRILPHMADSTDFITMFIDEAKLAAQLTHSNIIHIYDLGKVEDYHYIAMEYVDGMDLRSILKLGHERACPLPPELALLITSKVANALDYAHRRFGVDGRELELVHRDVSPQNILISYEGDIKLCDFGIAKAATKMSQTQTGALKGKLQYMSPEQAWGRKVDRRSDIYSLGLVLHEMLTGERLFTGDTDLAILEKARDARIVPPSLKNGEVPSNVDQIVLKALSKEPQARYQNASELEKEINAVLYTFRPTPGPADLAIYMNRLLEATPPASDEQIDAAFAVAASAPSSAPQAKKGKGLVISTRNTPAEPLPAIQPPSPAPPTDHPSPEPAVAAEPPKSHAGLFAGLGVAAVAVIAGAIYVFRGGSTPGVQTVSVPTPSPATISAAAGAIPAPPGTTASQAPAKVVDPRAVVEEARRLAALQAEELRKAGAAKGAAPAPAKAAAALAPDLSLSPSRPLRPPVQAEAPTAVPTQRPTPEPARVVEVPTKAPPVEVPTVAAAPPPVPPPLTRPVREGDLVGPGEGVVEPRLVRLGAFVGLPPQARQVKRLPNGTIGTATVMVLVTERGTVADTRIISRSPYRFVDDAAVAALKGGKIQPATKDGVRVKMWKAFAIPVTP